MTTKPNDPQAYKEIVVRDIKKILGELNKDLPWLVADIAISMQDRMGKNNPFVQKTLDDILAGLSEEDIANMSFECMPDSNLSTGQPPIGIGLHLDSERVHDILAKPAFSLDKAPSENCAPCDGNESGPIAMGILGGSAKKQFAKIKLAQHIATDVQELEEHKKNMLENIQEFKDEIAGIGTILEVIEGRCQK